MPIPLSPIIIDEDIPQIPHILQKIKSNLSNKNDLSWKDLKAQILTKDSELDIAFSCPKEYFQPLTQFLGGISFSFKYDQRIYRPATKLWHKTNDPLKPLGSLWHLPKIFTYFYCFQKLPLILDSDMRFFNSLITYPLSSFFQRINNILRHDSIYDVRFCKLGETFLSDLNTLIPSSNPNPDIFQKKIKQNIINVEEFKSFAKFPESTQPEQTLSPNFNEEDLDSQMNQILSKENINEHQ